MWFFMSEILLEVTFSTTFKDEYDYLLVYCTLDLKTGGKPRLSPSYSQVVDYFNMFNMTHCSFTFCTAY